MRKAAITLSNEILRRVDSPTDELWTLFKNNLTSLIEKYVPHRPVNQKSHLPWITATIKRLINTKNKMYRKMKKTGREDLKEKLRVLHRNIQKMTRRSYWDYLNNIFHDEPAGISTPKNKNKRLFSYIKTQKSSNVGVAPLKKDGRLTSDPIEQAEILNTQFQSVFGDGKTYTDAEFTEKTGMKDSNIPLMEDIHIDVNGVRKLLSQLNPHKASGPDGISGNILKELAEELAPGLTKIYQSSLKQGIVPTEWKKAFVAPIFKKGEQYNPANYRPVSLTCIACKMLEHILVSSMMQHFEDHCILTDNQHGFRSKRSCETQLLELSEELTTIMESGGQTDILIMDFAKAFDRVNHSLLVHKMKRYGIQGPTLNWIQDFLNGRTQSVVVNGSSSSCVPVRSGVPQGSVLGPCLFLAYINDLPDNLTSMSRLFADDTAVYATIKNASDQDLLQQDLDHLAEWESKWDMMFHPLKCVTLPVSRKKEVLTPSYKLHSHTLENVSRVKYLGVTITGKMDWSSHIHEISKRANQTLGFLRRNLKISSTLVKEQAYKTYVRPLLEYASPVWDVHTLQGIIQLEAIQRRAARFVLNRYSNRSSVGCMLTSLDWPSLESRRKNARLTMLYKIRNHLAHCPLIRGKMKAAPDRRRRAHSQQLALIPARTKYRGESFLPSTVKDWNTLDKNVVEADSLDTFVSRLPFG